MRRLALAGVVVVPLAVFGLFAGLTTLVGRVLVAIDEQMTGLED